MASIPVGFLYQSMPKSSKSNIDININVPHNIIYCRLFLSNKTQTVIIYYLDIKSILDSMRGCCNSTSLFYPQSFP